MTNTKPTKYNKPYTMVIPDIHGLAFIFNQLLDYAVEKNFHVVQLGDLVDAYDTTITRESEIDCLNIAKEYQQKYDFDFIYGNHELSYLNPHNMRASRYHSGKYKNKMSKLIVSIPFKTHVYFPFFAENESILITHAGLSMQHALDVDLIIKEKGYIIDKIKLMQYLEQDHTHSSFYSYSPPLMFDIGICRGGGNRCGGIFWNDFNFEYAPIWNLRQIFGHTRIEQATFVKYARNTYNIDSFNSGFTHGGYIALIDNYTGEITYTTLKNLNINY